MEAMVTVLLLINCVYSIFENVHVKTTSALQLNLTWPGGDESSLSYKNILTFERLLVLS